METLNQILAGLNDPQARHAAVVHFPIAISVLGLPFVALLCLTKGRVATWRFSVVGLYLGLWVGALVATRTGTAAKSELGNVAVAARELIGDHEWLADRVWIFGLLTAAAALATNSSKLRTPALALTLLCALATSGWVGLVGHHGGTAVYTYGAGTPNPVSEPIGASQSGDSEIGATGDPRVHHFETRVLPLLTQTCMGCHGPGEFASSELSLTSAAGALRGGTRGPAIVPGDPEESLLVQAVAGTHESLRMPLGADPLDADQIAALRDWIAAGAVWPEGTE